MSINFDLATFLENGKNGFPQSTDDCLAAVKLNAFLIRSVVIQTDDVCKLAVDTHPHSIQYIDNPSTYLKEKAVSQDPWALQYIDTQSVDLCTKALRLSWNTYTYSCINEEIIESEEFKKAFNTLLKEKGTLTDSWKKIKECNYEKPNL